MKQPGALRRDIVPKWDEVAGLNYSYGALNSRKSRISKPIGDPPRHLMDLDVKVHFQSNRGFSFGVVKFRLLIRCRVFSGERKQRCFGVFCGERKQGSQDCFMVLLLYGPREAFVGTRRELARVLDPT